jgi:hypothetical protein
LPALASAPGLTLTWSSPDGPARTATLLPQPQALPCPARPASNGSGRTTSSVRYQHRTDPRQPVSAADPLDPVNPCLWPGPGRLGQHPRFECPKRGSGRQIVSQDNLHINQIRSTPGAHGDPICTPGLVIAEDPPAAQSGGFVRGLRRRPTPLRDRERLCAKVGGSAPEMADVRGGIPRRAEPGPCCWARMSNASGWAWR